MAEEAIGSDDGTDDFDRIVAAFKKHEVEFIIAGGFAVIYHGYVRDTSDLDLYIKSSQENARRAVAALEEAGFSSPDLTPDVFLRDNGIHLGEKPVEVDVLSNLKGVTWEQAWAQKEAAPFGPAEVYYLSLNDLIANKRAVGRLRDLADLEQLERIHNLPPRESSKGASADSRPKKKGNGFER